MILLNFLSAYIKNNTFLLILGFLLFLPTALYLYWEISISIGLTCVMGIFLFMIRNTKKIIVLPKGKSLKTPLIVVLLLLIHTLCVYFLFGDEPNFLRILPSIALIGILILVSSIFFKFVTEIPDEIIGKAIKILFHFMLFIGYLSLILIKYNLAPIYTKSMIFFSEPSHFAMILTPLALGYLYTLNLSHKLLYLLLMLILGALLPNLTLLLGTFIIMFSLLKFKHLAMSTLVSILVVMIFANDTLYYISTRINFLHVTSRDDNLSLLIYLSGIERGYLDLMHSYGLGIGFNNFGYMGPIGVYTAMAKEAMNGYLLCFNDGSFLFGKVLGELGIFGIVLTLIYLYYFIKTLVLFKASAFQKNKDVFFASFLIMFSSYLFVRGMGYFTSTTFMFASSIYWYNVNHIMTKHR